jgi:hypothetical protein
VFIDRTLFISQGLKVSNGTNGFIGKGNAAESYLKSLGDFELYAHVPIKCLTVNNLIYEDFLAAQERIGGHLKEVVPDWPGYFTFCYDELLSKKYWGYMSPVQLQSLFEEWERALSTFDQATQTATKEKINKLPQPGPPPLQIKAAQKISLATLSVDFIKRLFVRLARPGYVEKGSVAPQDKNQGFSALELAGF